MLEVNLEASELFLDTVKREKLTPTGGEKHENVTGMHKPIQSNYQQIKEKHK